MSAKIAVPLFAKQGGNFHGPMVRSWKENRAAASVGPGKIDPKVACTVASHRVMELPKADGSSDSAKISKSATSAATACEEIR